MGSIAQHRRHPNWTEFAAAVAAIAVLAFGSGLVLGRLSGNSWMFGPGPTAGPIWSPSATPSVSPTPSAISMPSARSEAVLAFSRASGKLILFGGKTEGMWTVLLGDTWTWDGARWNQLQLASTSPSGRWGASSAYDAGGRAFLLHGGWDSSNTKFFNDYWRWDGTRWLLLGPDTVPPGSGGDPFNGANHALVWDPSRTATLLFATSIGQTWSWDGSAWSLVAVDGEQPGRPGMPGSPGAYDGPANLAYDASSGSIVFYSHDYETPVTFVLHGTKWARSASTSGSASHDFTMAADEARSNVVLFGQQGDTWTWSSDKWTARNPLHSPPGRVGGAMAYDPVHHVVVLFGGRTATGLNDHDLNDLWAWNGDDWTELQPT